MTARAAALVLLVAMAAGCGGGPSAEETRAELRRWASAVDDICRATQVDIAARGYADDLVDLQRVTEHASADVRGAIERIRDVPLAEEARPRVRAFLAELEKIEPRLSEMTETAADGGLKEIGMLGVRLADATQLFQRSAEAAGLRECADTRQFDAVLDAFTAPVYATQIARLELWLARAVRRVGDFYPPWSPRFARHVRRVGNVVEEAERRLGNLIDFKPNRAVEAADELEFALDAYETDLNAFADELRGGRWLTPVGVKQFNRAIAKHRRKLDACIAALWKAIDAKPLVEPRLEPDQTTA